MSESTGTASAARGDDEPDRDPELAAGEADDEIADDDFDEELDDELDDGEDLGSDLDEEDGTDGALAVAGRPRRAPLPRPPRRRPSAEEAAEPPARRRLGRGRPAGSRAVSTRPAPTSALGTRRGGGPGTIRSIGVFYRQVVAELRKVVWPTRQELVTYTSVVLVFVIFMVLLVSALDFAFSQGVLKVFGGTSGSG